MIIKVTSPILIKIAWGPRESYPSTVTASHKMWISWFFKNLPSWVTTNKGATNK
jgi:hypothetical protein